MSKKIMEVILFTCACPTPASVVSRIEENAHSENAHSVGLGDEIGRTAPRFLVALHNMHPNMIMACGSSFHPMKKRGKAASPSIFDPRTQNLTEEKWEWRRRSSSEIDLTRLKTSKKRN
jgi:hypothetical protein